VILTAIVSVLSSRIIIATLITEVNAVEIVRNVRPEGLLTDCNTCLDKGTESQVGGVVIAGWVLKVPIIRKTNKETLRVTIIKLPTSGRWLWVLLSCRSSQDHGHSHGEAKTWHREASSGRVK
jgi:hypothetical protein